ncbi:SDR family oxidoreductase [Arenibaculum sp.]|jgi:3-oxoacyl-[acyl-carrier protein] reductase|uniref:SDR family oxidoreductase n=1 Tax=Arenibaculum sp. TaxID=2865862 RepID=UPI002E161255|nr:SDR family oxidoreductase [Arenibaculum sp.]
MDLGLSGRKAVVCAASRGLGRACAEQLAAEGAEVVLVARTAGPLERAAGEIGAATGATVRWAVADVSTDAGIEAVLRACPEPDILVNNAGGPPPGDFRHWDRETWYRALDANMLSAILLMRATVDGMIARGFGRVVNITSSAVRSPLPILGLSNGARAGLTGFVAGLAREVAPHGVTINNLLPGPFETDRLASNFEARAEREGKSPGQVREEALSKSPARRFGRPAELGAMCAFLCSPQAGYVNGQNIVLDGGAHSGLV